MAISLEMSFAPRIAARKMTKEEWRSYYRAARIERRRIKAFENIVTNMNQAAAQAAESISEAAKAINEWIEKASLSFETMAEFAAELAEYDDEDGCDNWYYVLRNNAKRSQNEFYAGYKQGQRDWLYGSPFLLN